MNPKQALRPLSRRLMLSVMPALASLSLLTVTSAAQAADNSRFISIGTGGATGVYYATGGAICRLVNKEREKFKKRCSVESTAASVFNVNAIKAGNLDIGFVQSDVQYDALKGEGQFKKAGPDSHLRAVLSLYPEPLTIVSRNGLGARGIEDFKKRRFNIGNPGSGTRASMEELLKLYGMKKSDFALASELKADEHGAALCDNKIDGFAFPAGFPSANIQDPTTTCAARLVPLSGPLIDRLVAEKPYYAKVLIPANTYPNNPQDTPTFGVLATLVSSDTVSADTVYAVVKSIFDNFDEFRKLHPALAQLDPQKMIQQGLSMPLHEGAQRYFRERGWIK